MISIHHTSSGATFSVRVYPRAKKNAIRGELGDALKLSLTAPPVEGCAHEACIEFFITFWRFPFVRYHSVRPQPPYESDPGCEVDSARNRLAVRE